MKRLLSFILSITMLLTMAIAVFANGTDDSMAIPVIKVGVCADFKPFEYYDENENLTGFDIELMNHIGKRIGFEIEYIDIPFDSLFYAILSGRIDCAISAITVTDERKEVVDFSEVYLETWEQIDEKSSQIVNYAIIFPGDSSEKEDLIEASGNKTIVLPYTLVNAAIKELKTDGAIDELMEKYDIPKANHAGAGPTGLGGFSVDSDNKKTSATSIEPSDWATDDIDKAKKLNIIGGNYNFPDSITREEFCGLVYNYYSLYADEVEVVNAGNPFLDTENQDVMVLNALGIINGKSKTEFAPDDLLTREEAAVILSRLINVAHSNCAAHELYYEFEDSANISDWAMDSVQRICNLGIMNGVGENKFAPQEEYTTEQAIATLVRVYASFVDGVFKVVDKDGNIVLNYADLVSCEAVEVNRLLNGVKAWCLEIEISDEGRRKFKEATERVVEYPSGENYLAIMVNGEIISCPAVMQIIDSDTILVTGDFTEAMAKDLANTIKSK
ncbi:MAG: transporter substrate-binding domain-containing protein [Clostridia bacterium]|nr:transporter substrate-binding domain-containing protein [Clostridia bacterium]